VKEIKTSPTIAYFSMEIGLESNLPTYSGGLGMLAGDTSNSAADVGIPLVVVTLLHQICQGKRIN
jgi:glycogen phosphorylase